MRDRAVGGWGAARSRGLADGGHTEARRTVSDGSGAFTLNLSRPGNLSATGIIYCLLLGTYEEEGDGLRQGLPILP
jgi:hypothetical protein